jgi:hypothetical protein
VVTLWRQSVNGKVKQRKRLWDLQSTPQVRCRTDGRSHCWVVGCRAKPGNASGKGFGAVLPQASRTPSDGTVIPSRPPTRAHEIRTRTATPPCRMDRDEQSEPPRPDDPQAARRRQGSVPVRPFPRAISGERRQRTKPARSWARLRGRDVAAETVLSAILGVAMCHEDDRQRGKVEYRRVQLAKRPEPNGRWRGQAVAHALLRFPACPRRTGPALVPCLGGTCPPGVGEGCRDSRRVPDHTTTSTSFLLTSSGATSERGPSAHQRITAIMPDREGPDRMRSF